MYVKVSTFLWCILGAGGLGIAYEKIKQLASLDLRALLYVALGLLIFGVCSIFCKTNKPDKGKES